jgi:hypothetical protein
MPVLVRLRKFIAVFCLSLITGGACAAESTLDLTLPAGKFYNEEAKSFLLAENDAIDSQVKRNLSGAVTPAAEFEPKLFTRKKVHEYLGLTTLALVALTTFTAPGDGCSNQNQNCSNQARPVNGTHAELGKATAVMAIATVASGLIAHWDDFNVEDGWTDPDNLHVMLGVTGAALLAYAVNKSMNVSSGQVSHAGIAELGALGMLIAVKLEW